MKTLYAHVKADGVTNFMNTLVADGLDAVSGPTGPAQGYGAPVNSAYTWTMPLDPPLTRAVTLGSGANIEVAAYVGVGTGAGSVSVTTQVLYDGKVMADGAAQTLNLQPANYPASHTYDKLTWSLKPTATSLAPGKTLVWTVTASGTATNVYLGSTDARGRSNIVLPVLSVAAAQTTAFHTLTGATVNATLQFTNTTSGLNQYNWTDAPGNATATLSVDGKNGTVTFTVLDRANKTLLMFTVKDGKSGTHVENLTGVPGTWRVLVNATQFKGKASFTLGPAHKWRDVVTPPAETSGTKSGTATPSTSGSSTSAGKGSPGLGTLPLLACIGLAFLAVRHRRERQRIS